MSEVDASAGHLAVPTEQEPEVPTEAPSGDVPAEVAVQGEDAGASAPAADAEVAAAQAAAVAARLMQQHEEQSGQAYDGSEVRPAVGPLGVINVWRAQIGGCVAGCVT